MELVSEKASGFIYVVALTGVTGVRKELPPDLTGFIARLRAHTHQRLVMGFGISTPEQARMVGSLLDGFIVGSALVKAGKDGAAKAVELAATLRQALD
jgi:tryptophan synthase alpha chain